MLPKKGSNFQKACLSARRGFSLVEVLIVVLIAGVAFTSFYTVSMFGTKHIVEAKNHLAAIALVNEEMEIVRNLAYDKVGTKDSVDIPGNLLQDQSLNRNGRWFDVHTSVRYFDDPLDGSYPADTIPNDYKLVKIIVSWKDSGGITQNVFGSSRFVPPGLETSVGGSPLSINVNSNSGGINTPVNLSTVHISNSTISPAIDDSMQTDSDGHIMLPAARISTGNKLVITKNGYETVETMDTTPSFIPLYRHVDIIANNLNQYSFEQNKLANLQLKTLDYQNNPVEGIGFTLSGGKIIGHDDFGRVIYRMSNTVGNPVFGLSSTTGTTNVSGEKIYAAISPGPYTATMSENADYQFIDFEPAITTFNLELGSDATYTMRVARKNDPGLFLKITDALDGSLVENAQISMTDNSNTEIFTGKNSSLLGAFFYPDAGATLSPGSYQLKVEAVGYKNQTQSINIVGNLTSLEIKLERN